MTTTIESLAADAFLRTERLRAQLAALKVENVSPVVDPTCQRVMIEATNYEMSKILDLIASNDRAAYIRIAAILEKLCPYAGPIIASSTELHAVLYGIDRQIQLRLNYDCTKLCVTGHAVSTGSTVRALTHFPSFETVEETAAYINKLMRLNVIS